jgi:hypothetical protein
MEESSSVFVTSTEGSAAAVESKRVLAYLKAYLRIRGENALQDVTAMAIKVMASFILSGLVFSNHMEAPQLCCCNIPFCFRCLSAVIKARQCVIRAL